MCPTMHKSEKCFQQNASRKAPDNFRRSTKIGNESWRGALSEHVKAGNIHIKHIVKDHSLQESKHKTRVVIRS